MEARDTAATARPDGTIALQRPRFWSGRFARISTGFVLGAGIGALPALLGGGDERDLAVALQIASLLAGAYAVLAAARAVRISRHAPVIAFYPDHVVLPLTAESRRSATVAYRDVLSVASWGRGESQQVVIASKRRTFTYPHASFAHRDGPAMLQQTLLYRLATLPEGAELRQRFERRQAIAAATRERGRR